MVTIKTTYMKKIAFLPLALVLLLAAACSMHTDTTKETVAAQSQSTDTVLLATMTIKESIKPGDSVLLNFTVHNYTDSTKKFLKWQTPFEPLLSKYLDIKNEKGEEVAYKGPMAKRMMPPPASAYLSLEPKDSLSATVDILKGYDLTKPGKYTVTYTSENISGLKVKQQASFTYGNKMLK